MEGNNDVKESHKFLSAAQIFTAIIIIIIIMKGILFIWPPNFSMEMVN